MRSIFRIRKGSPIFSRSRALRKWEACTEAVSFESSRLRYEMKEANSFMLLKLKVKTNSKENKIEKLKDDEFRVFVKVKPEQGLANQKVLELMAEYLDIPKQKISLIKGHTAPSKIIEIRE